MNRWYLAVTLLLLLIVSAIIQLGRSTAETSQVVQQPVFISGQEGYHTFRIPALLVTPRGTVLAFCEGRKHSLHDHGDIDLVLKRSTDGGKTWSKLQVIWDDGPNTCGNPCPVVDRQQGRIWLLMTHNLGDDTESVITMGKAKGTRTVWISYSDDDGETWSKPANITHQAKRPGWTWYATGPGVGIQLANGRLLISCDHKEPTAKGVIWRSHVIYSDDHGKTWHVGGIVGPQCNECQAAELSDGRVMLNIRSYRGKHRRLVAVSQDGGLTFGPLREDAALVEPVCQASLLRWPYPLANQKSMLLFSNPSSQRREKLTVRASFDDGRTWPSHVELYGGPSAYSCLAALDVNTIGCLYERGQKNPYEAIYLARLPLQLLLD
ncbi:MAG: sialidase family protein [Gemmatales bacterium]|nr:sialidase family protein [Gemmatales bacterium]